MCYDLYNPLMWNYTCTKTACHYSTTKKEISINSCLWLSLFIATCYRPWMANMITMIHNCAKWVGEKKKGVTAFSTFFFRRKKWLNTQSGAQSNQSGYRDLNRAIRNSWSLHTTQRPLANRTSGTEIQAKSWAGIFLEEGESFYHKSALPKGLHGAFSTSHKGKWRS